MPKSIIAFLVNRSKKMLPQELVKEMFKEEKFEPYFIENPLIYEKRMDCKKSIEALSKSLTTLNTIKYMNNAEENNEIEFQTKIFKPNKYMDNESEINEEVKKSFNYESNNENNSDNSDIVKEINLEKNKKKSFKEIKSKKPKIVNKMMNQPNESSLENPYTSNLNKAKPISKKTNTPLDVDSSNIQINNKNDFKLKPIMKKESNPFIHEELKGSNSNELFGEQKDSSIIQIDKIQNLNIDEKSKDQSNENRKENDKEDSNDENDENNENDENEKEQVKNNENLNKNPNFNENQQNESHDKILPINSNSRVNQK